MGAIRVCRHEGTNHRDALRGLAPATRLTHDRHDGISPSRRLVAGIIEFPAVFPRRDWSRGQSVFVFDWLIFVLLWSQELVARTEHTKGHAPFEG